MDKALSGRNNSIDAMIRFAEVFDDEEIVSAPRRQLGWTLKDAKGAGHE